MIRYSVLTNELHLKQDKLPKMRELISCLAQGKKERPQKLSENAPLFLHNGSCFVKVLCLYSENALKSGYTVLK